MAPGHLPRNSRKEGEAPVMEDNACDPLLPEESSPLPTPVSPGHTSFFFIQWITRGQFLCASVRVGCSALLKIPALPVLTGREH